MKSEDVKIKIELERLVLMSQAYGYTASRAVSGDLDEYHRRIAIRDNIDDRITELLDQIDDPVEFCKVEEENGSRAIEVPAGH